MTLAEYCARGGNGKATAGSVVLRPEEVIVHEWMGTNDYNPKRIVRVIEFNIPYVQAKLPEYDDTLWTMDDDGNPHLRSVFNFPKS